MLQWRGSKTKCWHIFIELVPTDYETFPMTTYLLNKTYKLNGKNSPPRADTVVGGIWWGEKRRKGFDLRGTGGVTVVLRATTRPQHSAVQCRTSKQRQRRCSKLHICLKPGWISNTAWFCLIECVSSHWYCSHLKGFAQSKIFSNPVEYFAL